MDTIHEEMGLVQETVEEVSVKKGFIIKAISLENMEAPKKIIVKIDLNGKPLGQSGEIQMHDKEALINWETFLEVTETAYTLLNELITHPLVFTVLCERVSLTEEDPAKKGDKGKKAKGKGDKSPSEKEKQPKDNSISNDSKKTNKSVTSKSVSSNNEVFNVLGVISVDMVPLLLGQGDIEEVIFVNPTTELKGSESIAWANLPKLKVSVVATGNILDELTTSITNILSFTLESLCNVTPDFHDDVEVAIILPTSQIIKFKRGTMLLDNKVWIPKRKKWFGLTDLQGQGALSLYKISDNVVNLYNTMEYEISKNSLLEKPRIMWNQLHRSLLDIDSEEIFKEKIMEYNCWPVEILIPDSFSKSGKQQEKKKPETLSERKSNHFITFLDLSRLIYPGEKTIRLTSQLYSYNKESMKERFGSCHILFDEATTPSVHNTQNIQDMKPKTASSKKEPKSESTKSKKGSLKSKGEKKENMDEIETLEDESVVVREPEPIFNDSGEPIFLVVEVELLKPLVVKREQEKVLESIQKIIPKRKPLTARQVETVNADNDYEKCIKSLIRNIHDEYQMFYNVDDTSKNSCRNFLLHLHATGAYSKMSESLKEVVAVHVREALGPEDPWGRMKFGCQDRLTTLYQEMANRMYAIVSSCPDQSMESYDPGVTSDDLQYFESEALEEGDYTKAHYYLLQRLEKSEKADPQVWIDFASYWKKKLEFEKAEECAKEAISLDYRHTNALLFHGLLSWLTEDFDVAEMFLLAVVTFNPFCMEGWVLIYMLHKQMGKQREANVELLHAKECISEFLPTIEGKSSSLLAWCAGMAEIHRIFLLTAAKSLSLSFPELAELALSYDLRLHGRTTSYLYYLAVCHYQQGRYTNSIIHLEESVKMHLEDDRLWALKGHNLYKLDKLKEAKESYHVAMNFKDQEDQHLIYLRLGNILLQGGDNQGARECYMVICRDSPTPLAWLGLGISAFVDDDMETAELALSEANMLDCKMGRVWGYLALVNLMLDRPLLFNKCIIQALKYGFEDQALMERIDSLLKLVQPSSS